MQKNTYGQTLGSVPGAILNAKEERLRFKKSMGEFTLTTLYGCLKPEFLEYITPDADSLRQVLATPISTLMKGVQRRKKIGLGAAELIMRRTEFNLLQSGLYLGMSAKHLDEAFEPEPPENG